MEVIVSWVPSRALKRLNEPPRMSAAVGRTHVAGEARDRGSDGAVAAELHGSRHPDGAPRLGLDGGVEHGFLLLEVQHQAQLGQRQAGRPAQAEERVVQVDRVAPQSPVVGGPWQAQSKSR